MRPAVVVLLVVLAALAPLAAQEPAEPPEETYGQTPEHLAHAEIVDVVDQPVLGLLDRARGNHNQDAGDQGDQGGVECDRQTGGDVAERGLDGVELLGGFNRGREAADRDANPDHGANEADDRDRPHEHLDQAEASGDSAGVGLGVGAVDAGGLGDVTAG